MLFESTAEAFKKKNLKDKVKHSYDSGVEKPTLYTSVHVTKSHQNAWKLESRKYPSKHTF